MANQVTGRILEIGSTRQLTSKTGNTYHRRDIVMSLQRFDPNTGEPVTDDSNTPQFSFMGSDRCASLDAFAPGQTVVVSFDIQGRRYTTPEGTVKIINDIRPYRIEPYRPQAYGTPVAPAVAVPASVQPSPQGTGNDPLPF